jgi:putative membrane protein
MRQMTRCGSLLLVGITAALGACSKGNGGADSTGAAPAAATTDSAAGTTAAPAPASTDSAAAANAGAANLSAANIASLIGMTNAAEIGQAKVAQEKATSADVKAFAKQMISDHQAMQKSVDSLAQAKGVSPTPPPQADQMKQDASTTLSTLNSTPKGAAFDKAYIDAQVAAHQKALNDLQNFANSAPDPDLKAQIQGAIPKVQAHLDKAQQIQSSLGAAKP